MNKKNSWFGHRGTLLRYSYANAPNENKEDLIESLAISGIQGVDLINSEVQNHKYNFFDAESTPFVLDAKLEVSSLINKAGRDYIFNIGEVIGSQTELYQETERTNAIDLDYPIKYKHHITFRIPDGYIVEGLEEVIEYHQIIDQDSTVVGEYSADYEMNENMVSINVSEYYAKPHFSIEDYSKFRTLINSAADFNKLSLVFIKE